MQNNKRILIVILLVVAVVGIAVWKAYSAKPQTAQETASAEQNTATSSPDSIITDVGNVQISGTGDAKVDIISNENIDTKPQVSITMMLLNKPLVFSVGYSPADKTIIQSKVKLITDTLKKNPDQFNEWLDLALIRKQIDDYQGAADIWEYLNKAYPANATSFANLGSLYHLDFKNFPKSEENYKKAIQNEPTRVSLYRGLFELYFYSYKTDTDAAPQTLKDGLKVLPKSTDLMVLLANYYKQKGLTNDAKTYYNQALQQAKIDNNQPLVDAIQKELQNL